MKRSHWTDEQLEELRRLYPNTKTKKLVDVIGHTKAAMYGMAKKLGLKKTAEFMASEEACRLRRGDKVGEPYQFKKGHVPANKGLRRPGWHAGRMRETQFRKGSRPPNYKPIGSTRLMDGYLQRKITDTGYPPRDWRGVHILMWEEHYGEIPKGYIVAFIDGDKTHVELNNLVLCHRRDIMRRNTIANYPAELRSVMHLSKKLDREIQGVEDEKRD